MPPQLALFIVKHGYLAIFSLVFLQEIGVPNPIPNELVLFFSGYLTSLGTLSFPLVFLTVVAADFIGTSLLYVVFYFLGTYLLQQKAPWLRHIERRAKKLSEQISNRGWWGIYLGRLIPLLRGYTSVAAGLLHVKPRTYFIVVAASAITWSGGYVIAGKIFAPYWQKIATRMTGIDAVLSLAIVALGIILISHAVSRYHKRRAK